MERTINEINTKPAPEAFIEDDQVRVVFYTESEADVRDIANGRASRWCLRELIFPDCGVTDVRFERVRPHVDNESLLCSLPGAQAELRPSGGAPMSSDSMYVSIELLSAATELASTSRELEEAGVEFRSLGMDTDVLVMTYHCGMEAVEFKVKDQ